MPVRNVNPGELITSRDWNDLVNALNALEERVIDLASGGAKAPPRITQVLPTGILTAGDQIRIYGTNFDFTRGAHSVFFGNTRATNFLNGSSDTLLIVQIPDKVEGATEAGTTITMSVGNLNGYTTWALTIKAKPEVTTGGFQFTYTGSQPTAPTQNTPIVYNFELKSFASQNVIITITPNIQVIPPLPPGVSDPGLPDLLDVIDADGTVRPDHRISLATGATKKSSLRLNLPSNTTGLRYSLSVTARVPGLTPVIESLPEQQVGLESEQPDPTITSFEFASVVQGNASFSTDTGGVSGIDGTLKVAQGTATIEMRTVFSNIPTGTTNSYVLSATVDAPANGWSASVNPVMQNPLLVHAPGANIPTDFDITAPGTAAAAVVRLTLTRQGVARNNKRTVAYRLLS
jgi:hypothetical protein